LLAGSSRESSLENMVPKRELGSIRPPVLEIAQRVTQFHFDRVYGGWWGRVIVDDGAEAVRRSADRYVARLHGDRPHAY